MTLITGAAGAAKAAVLSLSGMAMDVGLLRRTYRRFVIVTAGRSGSTLLTECLAQHPQVVSYDEVFHESWVLDRWRRSIRQRHPAVYLDRFVYRWFPPSICAVGFVLHYYHCWTGSRRSAWHYLAQSDAQILHLRRNPLHTLVDSRVARQIQIWNARSREEAQATREARVHIDHEECLAYFRSTDEHWAAVERMFGAHRRMDLWYEDLAENLDAQIGQVEDWLGIDRRPFAPRTYRQVTRPTDQAVANYAQLREHFEGTPWIGYFDR